LLNVDAATLGPIKEELLVWMMNYMNEGDIPSFAMVSDFLSGMGVDITFEAYYFAVFEMDDPFD
jgi:hypothetical protein